MEIFEHDGRTLSASHWPNPGKRALVFIHGAGGNSRIWHKQNRFFKDDHRIAGVNLAGHGRSEPGGRLAPSVAAYAGQTLAAMDRLGIERAVLVGHSMGGGVALRLALDRPDRVEALVTVGSGARLKIHPAIYGLMENDPVAAVEYMVDVSFGSGVPKFWKAVAAREMGRVDLETFKGDFNACSSFDVMDRVGEINLPALAVVGDEDRLTPVKYSEYLRDRMPDCRLEILPGAGHMAMIEQADLFNAALARFLLELTEKYC